MSIKKAAVKTYWLVLDGIPVPGRKYKDINQTQSALAKIIADKPAEFTQEQIGRLEVLPIGFFSRNERHTNRWGE